MLNDKLNTKYSIILNESDLIFRLFKIGKRTVDIYLF